MLGGKVKKESESRIGEGLGLKLFAKIVPLDAVVHESAEISGLPAFGLPLVHKSPGSDFIVAAFTHGRAVCIELCKHIFDNGRHRFEHLVTETIDMLRRIE